MAKDESVEEALLLASHTTDDHGGSHESGGGGGLSVREEVKKQLWLAGPLIAGALLQNLIQMISVMYVGHLGELALAGASMASSFASVTGFSLLLKEAALGRSMEFHSGFDYPVDILLGEICQCSFGDIVAV